MSKVPILRDDEKLPLIDKGAYHHEAMPHERPRCLVIVPGHTKTTEVFQVFEVDVEELSCFLPMKALLKTNNFYAAQTFVKGYHAREK